MNGAVVFQKMLNLYVFFLTLNMGKVYCHDSFSYIASENPKVFQFGLSNHTLMILEYNIKSC